MDYIQLLYLFRVQSNPICLPHIHMHKCNITIYNPKMKLLTLPYSSQLGLSFKPKVIHYVCNSLNNKTTFTLFFIINNNSFVKNTYVMVNSLFFPYHINQTLKRFVTNLKIILVKVRTYFHKSNKSYRECS